MCPLTPWCATLKVFDIHPCSIGTKLAYEIMLAEWLKVPNVITIAIGFERFQ